MEFVLDGNLFWRAKTTLPSWRGFLDRSGAYGTQGVGTISDGAVDIIFAPEGRGAELLEKTETGLAEWFLKNEAAVSQAALAALQDAYPVLQDHYGYSGEDKAAIMPDIASARNFQSLVGLHSVYIHQLQKDGLPYIGLELGCTWDDEHGLGIMMHGTRKVAIGDADIAFSLGVAQEDSEKLG